MNEDVIAVASFGQFAALQEGETDSIDDACGIDDPSRVCEQVFEWTDNATVAGLSEWVIDRPFRIVLILLMAWLLNRLARRAISRLSDRIQSPSRAGLVGPLHRLRTDTTPRPDDDAETMANRSPARAEAIEAVLKSVVSVAVWSIALLLVLGEIGINLAPLIAGAGIAGVALGFGAQSLVKDFLAGLFILIEDQYGVGDVIEVGAISGTVENISLRSTRLRDVEGTVWHLANGEITQLGNHSQLWSNCVIDINVAYDTDVRKAMEVMERVAQQMQIESESEEAEFTIDDPVVQGVQALAESAVTIRLVIKTDPLSQWQVKRNLRLRIKEAFDDADIRMPSPQRTVRVMSQTAGDESATTGAETANPVDTDDDTMRAAHAAGAIDD